MRLILPVQGCTVARMEELEALDCLMRLRVPEATALAAAPGTIVDAPVYVSDPAYGPHMLLCVGINQSVPRLATHPDNEEFLLVGDGRAMRPLVLIVSRLPRPVLEQRAREGTLSPDDLIAMEMVFNDPERSFFTMNTGVPHCEVSMEGAGAVPCFFVTEARDLPSHAIDLGGFELALSR